MVRDIVSEIQKEIGENKVVVYMKGTKEMPQCGFSGTVVRILEKFHVPFKDVDILADPEKREGIKKYSDWPTLPQVYIGGQFIGGCDIVRELDAKGELEILLKKTLEQK